jgi:hypothetical protein
VAYNILNGLAVSWLAGRLIGCGLGRQLSIVAGTPLYFLTNLKKRL